MKISHNIFAFVLSLFIASAIHAQQNEPKFEIKFFNDRGSIGLICEKGCSWTDLWIRKMFLS